MKLQGKRVLVTGGTGFIGSHLVERLIEQGCRVRVLANYRSQPSVGNLAFTPHGMMGQVELTWGDLGDRDSVLRVIDGCEIVFHLAALIGIPYSYIAPGSYVQTNVVGTLNVLQAARTTGIERLVHTSTSEAYGSAQYVPIDEKHPLVGQSPYSATKIAADKLVESFACSFALPVVTVRPFNVFGPRQSDRAIIPTIIAQRLAGSEEIEIGDPTPRRDFTYVTDTVDGFLKACACDAAIGKTFNVGSGQSISIAELADEIFELTGGGRLITSRQRVRPAASEVRELLCDNRQARELLDWRPVISLKEGLLRTIEFVRLHSALFAPRNYRV